MATPERPRRSCRKWRPPPYVRSSVSLDVSEPDSPLPAIDLSSPYSPQPQSPLFSKIPPEIRNTIFSLALEQYEDLDNAPFDPGSYCYRPGHRAKLRVSLGLLRTCRAVYAETRCLPTDKGYELTLWCGTVDRAPPNSSEQQLEVSATSCPKGPWSQRYRESLPDGYADYDSSSPLSSSPESFSSFLSGSSSGSDSPGRKDSLDQKEQTTEQQQPRQRMPPGRLHVFAQMWWLEHCRLSLLLKTWKIAAREIAVTIRHTDWWYWEDDQALSLDRGWVNRLRLPETVEAFDLELETVERKEAQLDAVVADARLWPVRRKDDVCLSARETAPSVARWVGSRRIAGKLHSETDSPGGLPYYVVTLHYRVAGQSAAGRG